MPEDVVPKNEDEEDEDEEEEEQQYGKRPRLSLIPPRSLLHDGKKNKGTNTWALAQHSLQMSSQAVHPPSDLHFCLVLKKKKKLWKKQFA